MNAKTFIVKARNLRGKTTIEGVMRLLSTHELAGAMGVSESSLKRWVDAGAIAATRTDGGHRRIPLREAMRFIRDRRARVERPELLGLPEIAVERARGGRLLSYLREGDEVAARGFFAARYLGGMTIAELADGPVREAMHPLGELWHHDAAGVFIEHRASEICLHAISALLGLMPIVPAGAPCAIGGAPSGDPYLIPSLLARLTLVEARINAINLGADTPVGALRTAVTSQAPRLVWLSITTPPDPAVAGALARWLKALPESTVAVVGGQQAQLLARLPPRVHRVSSMAQLADIAATLAVETA